MLQGKRNDSRRSRSKGCPYDNAVSEATYKAFKTEFVSQYQFETMAHLELECFDYVNWWNHHRIHSSLGYKTPIEVRYAEARCQGQLDMVS